MREARAFYPPRGVIANPDIQMFTAGCPDEAICREGPLFTKRSGSYISAPLINTAIVTEICDLLEQQNFPGQQ